MRQKRQAYFAVAARLVLAPPATVRQVCTELGNRYGIDFMALSDRNALTPGMIAEMQNSGLVEFGGHSMHHAYLSGLDNSAVRSEIAQSKRDCEALLGAPIRHFAYPYGDRGSFGGREKAICHDLGFLTAVTTESSPIYGADRDRLLSLPRLTYNGYFQNTPLLDLLLSGALSRLRDGLPGWLMQALVRNSKPPARSAAANGGRELLPGAQLPGGKYNAAEL
jgi:peptidoglycan/xylan/chitin deacetylase (PgdA/CDA1 family)